MIFGKVSFKMIELKLQLAEKGRGGGGNQVGKEEEETGEGGGGEDEKKYGPSLDET